MESSSRPLVRLARELANPLRYLILRGDINLTWLDHRARFAAN
jgi:hypothetical protein